MTQKTKSLHRVRGECTCVCRQVYTGFLMWIACITVGYGQGSLKATYLERAHNLTSQAPVSSSTTNGFSWRSNKNSIKPGKAGHPQRCLPWLFIAPASFVFVILSLQEAELPPALIQTIGPQLVNKAIGEQTCMLIPQTFTEHWHYARPWTHCWDTIRPPPQGVCILEWEANNKPTGHTMNTRLGNILEEMKAGSRAAMLFQIGWPLWWPGWKAELREQVCDNDIALSSKGALKRWDLYSTAETEESCTNTQINNGWGGANDRLQRQAKMRPGFYFCKKEG